MLISGMGRIVMHSVNAPVRSESGTAACMKSSAPAVLINIPAVVAAQSLPSTPVVAPTVNE
jgi:hypothetical protein